MAHPRDNRARRPITPERLEEIKKIKEKRKKKEDNQKVKSAGNWLFITAALLGLSFGLESISLLQVMNFNDITFLIYVAFEIMIIGSFIVLGVWSKSKPYPAILTGLIIFTAFIALNVIGDPSSIFSGIIWKILIYSALIKGLMVANKDKKSLIDDTILDDVQF